MYTKFTCYLLIHETNKWANHNPPQLTYLRPEVQDTYKDSCHHQLPCECTYPCHKEQIKELLAAQP